MTLTFDRYLDIESSLLYMQTLIEGIWAVSNDQLQCLMEEKGINEIFLYRGNAIMHIIHDIQEELGKAQSLFTDINDEESAQEN